MDFKIEHFGRVMNIAVKFDEQLEGTDYYSLNLGGKFQGLIYHTKSGK
jgi:hypothetical protein